MNLEDLPKPKPQFVIGEPLDSVSIAELQLRITAFQDEIERLKADIAKKQASKAAADAFFKS